MLNGQKAESNWAEKSNGHLITIPVSVTHPSTSLPRALHFYSKWLQVNGFYPWLLWEPVTKAKSIYVFQHPSCRDLFKEACGFDPVRECRTQWKFWNRDVFSLWMVWCGQGEVCGYSSHLSLGVERGGRGGSLRTKKWSWNYGNEVNFCTPGLHSHMVQ